MIRVVLADDQALVRSGLRTLVEREPDMAVVGEAGDGRATLDVVRRTRPDVLLLDVRMPGMDGLETLAMIATDPGLTTTRVVVVTTFDIDEYIFRALRQGAAGFLLKDADPGDLVRAIRVVASGEGLLSPSVTQRVIEVFGSGQVAATPELGSLTLRERELVAWAATGRTNDEIAAELSISPATVRTHLGRAIQKLGARDRVQLVVIAVQNGLTVPRATT